MANAKWTESIRAAESVDDLKGQDRSLGEKPFSRIFYSAPVGRMSGGDEIIDFGDEFGVVRFGTDDEEEDAALLFGEDEVIFDRGDGSKPVVERERIPLSKPDATPAAPGKTRLRGDGITWDSKPTTSGRPIIEVTPPVITPSAPSPSRLRGTAVAPETTPERTRLRGTGISIEAVPTFSRDLPDTRAVPPTPMSVTDLTDDKPIEYLKFESLPRPEDTWSYQKGSDEANNAIADALTRAILGRETQLDVDLIDELQTADESRLISSIAKKKIKEEIPKLDDESLLVRKEAINETIQAWKDDIKELFDEKRTARNNRDFIEYQEIQDSIDFAMPLLTSSEELLDDVNKEIAKNVFV
jgi:hypothetical protein